MVPPNASEVKPEYRNQIRMVPPRQKRGQMKFIADFHIHSKYSRATSKDMDLAHIARWAKLKGITLMGTGDFTYHLWLEELKANLQDLGNGLFKYRDVYFILTTEISNIYSKGGRTYRIHNIVFSPSLKTCDKINAALSGFGNLASEGRPILGLDAAELTRIIFDIDEDCMVVPSHVWTPWFSLFGSMSGFDRIEDCFEDQTPKIFALETGLSCYDEETEVLTQGGWKKFSQIQQSDKICTLNLNTDNIEFQMPIKIFTYKYKGKMYRLKTKRVDLLVTPNHKLLYSPCDFRNRKLYSLKEAGLLFHRSKIFKKDGIWVGKNPKYFILPAVKIRHGSRYYSGRRVEKRKEIPIEPWLKFFGFWLAEGWVSEGKDGDYNVCVSNRDQNLLSEIEHILNSFGYKTFRSDNIVRVRNFQLFHYLKKFGKCYNKFIPLEIKSLSKELLEILLEYYIKGDGHIYGRAGKGLSATTTSIRLRDDLQEIALKAGISAYYKLGYKKGKTFISPGCKKLYQQRNDSWIIFFIRRNRPIILPSTIKKYNYTESWIDYDGLVYCVNVPNRVIYIRRNGIPLWCGNSDPAMNWRLSRLDKYALISNSDSHSPSRIGREANVFDCQLDYRAIKEALKTKDKKRFLYTIEFFPQEGKYHYDGHRNCQVRLSPRESRTQNNRCPRCGRPLTLGVMNRVEQLADRPDGFVPSSAIPFKHLVPLDEIIASGRKISKGSQAIEREYHSVLARFGSEFKVLLEVPEDELLKALPGRIAQGIIRVRESKVRIVPGFDGVYGKVEIFDEGDQPGEKQLSFF
jgi:PHP family Zn ribbon phosphoesterase